MREYNGAPAIPVMEDVRNFDLAYVTRRDHATVFTGSCCLPDGSCIVVTEEGCMSIAGVYGGDMTVCSTEGCASGGVLVQSGTVLIPDGQEGAKVLLESPVDPTKAFLMFSTSVGANVPDEPKQIMVTGELMSEGMIFMRQGNIGDLSIHWYVAEFEEGVRVQRGCVEMNSTTVEVPMDPVDIYKSFPLLSFRHNYIDYDRKHFLQSIIWPDVLQLKANAFGGPNMVSWQVVEYQNANVKHGQVQLGKNQTTTSVSIPTVNPDKAWLLFTYSTEYGEGQDVSAKMIRGLVSDANTLTFDRDVSKQDVYISWYLVEFTDHTTVQHDSRAFDSGVLQADISINPVDLGRAIASGGGLYSQGGNTPVQSDQAGVAMTTFDLTSPDNLRLNRGVSDEKEGRTTDIGWFVVEFGLLHEETGSVQH